MRQAIRNFMVGPDGIAGVALIEFTIFLPIVVVMSIYTMDFGLLIWRKMEVQHAAQAGAQYAMVHGYSSPSSISSAVTGWRRTPSSARPSDRRRKAPPMRSMQ